jgi:hypothetical protein
MPTTKKAINNFRKSNDMFRLGLGKPFKMINRFFHPLI